MTGKQQMAVWIAAFTAIIIAVVSMFTAGTISGNHSREINGAIIKSCVESGGNPVIDQAYGRMVSCTTR